MYYGTPISGAIFIKWDSARVFINNININLLNIYINIYIYIIFINNLLYIYYPPSLKQQVIMLSKPLQVSCVSPCVPLRVYV